MLLIRVIRVIRGVPVTVKLMNGGRVDVGGRGNGTDAAVPHASEEEGFATDEYVETGFGKRVEKSLGVVPIARAVFHPGDCIRISRKEALDQSRGDANHRDWWNVVEIN